MTFIDSPSKSFFFSASLPPGIFPSTVSGKIWGFVYIQLGDWISCTIRWDLIGGLHYFIFLQGRNKFLWEVDLPDVDWSFLQMFLDSHFGAHDHYKESSPCCKQLECQFSSIHRKMFFPNGLRMHIQYLIHTHDHLTHPVPNLGFSVLCLRYSGITCKHSSLCIHQCSALPSML